MDHIQHAAFVSVGRGCAFAGLAVFVMMAGLSFDPLLAAKAAGYGCLIITGFLIANGMRARYRPFKKTETWLILPKHMRPPESIAQRVVGETLRQTYLWFAHQLAMISMVVWAVALVMQLAGVEPWQVPVGRT